LFDYNQEEKDRYINRMYSQKEWQVTCQEYKEQGSERRVFYYEFMPGYQPVQKKRRTQDQQIPKDDSKKGIS
jgi:hypothetical protein